MKRANRQIRIHGHTGAALNSSPVRLILALVVTVLPSVASAQEVERILFPDRAAFAAHERELGQVPVSAFQLGGEQADDLKIEVWAQSPMIFSPVAMDVDAKGRIWATEGIDYHCAQRVKAGQSIIVLSDTDHDGVADKSHVFVTESGARQAPLGIAVFDNRIVLSATPSITVYTDVDRNAEAIIIETIHKAYPDHSILAEESGIREADGEFRWIIDPLDGTTNFLHGIPHHCTSIAITQGNAVLHGVTVDHLRNEEFTASRGEGAYLNGRRIRVTGTSSLSTSMMASGIPWHALQKHGPAHEAMYREFIGITRGVRQMGSAALDLAYVAAGRIDGYFEIGLKEWDTAAGSVLVREAGGFVGDIAGGDRFLETGNIVAANPRIFKEMLRSIRAAVKASNDGDLALG